MEFDLDGLADVHLVVRAADHVGEDLPALLDIDDDRHVGDGERRGLGPPHDGPAVDDAATGARDPREPWRAAVRADHGRGVGAAPTVVATLEEELSP